MSATINAQLCPFCKSMNNCMIQSDKACWCKSVVVPAELSEMVPVELMRKSCICQDCVALFHESPSEFMSKYS